MTIAYWCVLVAAVMPLVWAGFAKFGGQRYDNAHPREWLGDLKGWPARANWAQVNSYESFPPFAAGVIIAHLTGGADQSTINGLALLYIVARILYGTFYITDRSTLRSFSWLAAFACIIGLFVAAA